MPRHAAARRVPSPSRVDAIAAQLEEDIVLGRIVPRERLLEQGLAQRFGTHRAAVRQALFDLERKGLIERVPNRGATVRDLSPDEVRDIYAVREELEAMAARIIPLPVSASDMKRMRALQGIHSRAVAALDLRAVFHSNLEFHRAVFALCGNRCLIEAIETLAEKAYGIRSWSNAIPEYLQRVKQDHLDILDALERGRRAELVRLCRRHLRPSQDVYIRAYRQRFDAR
ncbi:MAG: GntR family transcriptional regulator [Betaproteobacteria bacterium]|nr:GntR family transcriptional regulator [Betaproteobacteria bacterium]